jgi:hypothetical protein
MYGLSVFLLYCCTVPWAGRQLRRLSCGSAGLGWNEWTVESEEELKTGDLGYPNPLRPPGATVHRVHGTWTASEWGCAVAACGRLKDVSTQPNLWENQQHQVRTTNMET